MPNKHGACNCCSQNCALLDAATFTNLGGLTPVDGDASIDSGRLKFTNSNVRINVNAMPPEGMGVSVNVSFNIATDGDVGRIYLGDWIIQVAPGSSAFYEIIDPQGDTCVHEDLVDLPVGDFAICAQLNYKPGCGIGCIQAKIGESHISCEVDGEANDTQSGVGTGTIAGTVYVTGITVNKVGGSCRGCNADDCTSDLDCTTRACPSWADVDEIEMPVALYVDLHAGGWTSRSPINCEACADVKGVYPILYCCVLGGCTWRYCQNVDCAQSCLYDAPTHYGPKLGTLNLVYQLYSYPIAFSGPGMTATPDDLRWGIAGSVGFGWHCDRCCGGFWGGSCCQINMYAEINYDSVDWMHGETLATNGYTKAEIEALLNSKPGVPLKKVSEFPDLSYGVDCPCGNFKACAGTLPNVIHVRSIGPATHSTQGNMCPPRDVVALNEFRPCLDSGTLDPQSFYLDSTWSGFSVANGDYVCFSDDRVRVLARSLGVKVFNAPGSNSDPPPATVDNSDGRYNTYTVLGPDGCGAYADSCVTGYCGIWQRCGCVDQRIYTDIPDAYNAVQDPMATNLTGSVYTFGGQCFEFQGYQLCNEIIESRVDFTEGTLVGYGGCGDFDCADVDCERDCHCCECDIASATFVIDGTSNSTTHCVCSHADNLGGYVVPAEAGHCGGDDCFSVPLSSAPIPGDCPINQLCIHWQINPIADSGNCQLNATVTLGNATTGTIDVATYESTIPTDGCTTGPYTMTLSDRTSHQCILPDTISALLACA